MTGIQLSHAKVVSLLTVSGTMSLDKHRGRFRDDVYVLEQMQTAARALDWGEVNWIASGREPKREWPIDLVYRFTLMAGAARLMRDENDIAADYLTDAAVVSGKAGLSDDVRAYVFFLAATARYKQWYTDRDSQVLAAAVGLIRYSVQYEPDESTYQELSEALASIS